MAGKIDVKNLYRRIGRLQGIAEAAQLIRAGAHYQEPLSGLAGVVGYYHLSAELFDTLGAAIDVAAGADDFRQFGANVQRDPRPSDALPPADEATIIRLPFPPNRKLAANKAIRGHYMGSAELLKSEKQRAYVALEAYEQAEPFYTEPVRCVVRIAWGKSLHYGKAAARMEQDRALDWDGAATCVKPFLDALTKAKIWTDDRLAAGDGRIIQDVDGAGDGYTEFMIWPVRS